MLRHSAVGGYAAAVTTQWAFRGAFNTFQSHVLAQITPEYGCQTLRAVRITKHTIEFKMPLEGFNSDAFKPTLIRALHHL